MKEGFVDNDHRTNGGAVAGDPGTESAALNLYAETEILAAKAKWEQCTLVERLRTTSRCVIFLDGARGPAEDVADALRKAADEIERLQVSLASVTTSRDAATKIIERLRGEVARQQSRGAYHDG